MIRIMIMIIINVRYTISNKHNNINQEGPIIIKDDMSLKVNVSEEIFTKLAP